MALYTKSELEKKSILELKTEANEHGIEIERGWKKPDLIEALLSVEEDELLDEEELEEELPEEDLEEDEDLEPELPEEEDEIVVAKPATKGKTRAVPAKKKADASDEDTLAAKQVASILSTNLNMAVDAKTLRQFFRSAASTIEAVGSGGRYEFLETDVPTIQKEFAAWKEGHASRGAKRGPRGTGRSKASNQVIEEIEEVEEIEELELEDDLDLEFEEEDLELEDEA